MKLLYLTNAIHGSGGLERVLSIKASYLVDVLGYEVAIMTLNSKDKQLFYEFSSKIKVYDIAVKGSTLSYIQQYSKGILRLVDAIKPHIVIVCDDGLKGFFVPFLLRKSIRIVYERHVSKEIEMHQNFTVLKKYQIKAKWLLMKFLAQNFDAFVVLTAGNKNEWTGLKNIKVISNPLSFYPKAFSSLENRKVIAVGKQSYQKGYDLLLKAWRKVIDRHPDWHLEIYGKKAPALALEETVVDLAINSQVSFYDPEKNIEHKYLNASIYVMSSRYEGFGMVLIEAMACGVPCVAFDCPYGPSDIIKDTRDGFLVEPQNYKDLAVKIITLIENENLRKEMGLKAKENVMRYLPVDILKEWDALFKELSK